jgi:hypothetical protein
LEEGSGDDGISITTGSDAAAAAAGLFATVSVAPADAELLAFVTAAAGALAAGAGAGVDRLTFPMGRARAETLDRWAGGGCDRVGERTNERTLGSAGGRAMRKKRGGFFSFGFEMRSV